jgi:uncharacterized protein (AIM24 family)
MGRKLQGLLCTKVQVKTKSNIFLLAATIWQDNQLSCLCSSFFLAEHSATLDVEVSNMKFLARTEEFWDSLEACGWWQLEQEGDVEAKAAVEKLANGSSRVTA